MIKWEISNKDFKLIVRIADRVKRDWPDYPDDRRTLIMDLNACHANGCPLDLAALLEANELEFSHDIGEIRKHLNRRTGKIEGCFVPRYALAK